MKEDQKYIYIYFSFKRNKIAAQVIRDESDQAIYA
jgi:hypothetical protein